MFPAELAETFAAGSVIVPEPSAALTVMLGELPRFASALVAFEVDFSCACQVTAPVGQPAVAPAPPPLVSP